MTTVVTKDLAFQHVFEPGDDPAYTALLLHGTGADEHDLVPIGRTVAPGKPLVSPLGKVREGRMPRWFARHEEGVFDEEDLRRRAKELAAFLDEAAAAYDLDPDRFVAVGFSNGANIAASLLLLHPDALAGAVLLRPMVPIRPDASPNLAGVPVYMASGRADRMVPADSARKLAEMLKAAGADVTHRFVDAGHGLTRPEVDDVRAWLADHEDAFAAREGST